ncbi:MAG TPA: Rne/Rng family ribonuclease [Bryobacteraceae bacterium]|nr:Rne/Rng family ribonuclease [Bryobacteraceae bacterium]
MSKELVVSSNRHETRVAIIEDDQVVEVYHQRENEYSLAGSIHKGRVTRVLPGMQSAFVDIGLERDAFLYVSDFFEDNDEYDKIVTSVEEKVLKLDRPAAAPVAAEPVAIKAAEPAVETPTEAAPAGPVLAPAPAREDRERRGRRSRRRRGQKNGRGLPESKFYSPRADTEASPEPPAAPVEPISETAPKASVAFTPEVGGRGDDFFVLPGESLAKYTHPGDEEDAAEASQPSLSEATFEAAAEPAEEAHEEHEPASVDAAPAAEPPAPEVVPVIEEESIEEAVTLEAAAEPEAEAEPLSEGSAAEALAEVQAEAEAIAEETVASAEAAEIEATAEAEPEGPEPARIPTSLTATLREQGPRYLHRVSRRMRRKGRGGAVAEATRPAQAEPRQQEKIEQRSAPRPESRGEKAAGTSPSISDLLREGQEIIVQIAKEPLGQKGARITSHIALPGRFLVYMPTVDHIGVSRKIPSDDERTRLKRILQTHRTGIPGGFIVRTAGEGHTEEELHADMMFLYNLWLDMRQKAERRPAPALIHHDLNVVERVLRDQLTSAFKSVWVDNEEAYESVLAFVQRFQPTLVSRVKMYTRSTPIFDEFGITAELEKALRPKVWLKSGGYIVINQTEALVAIDVNTGKFVGKSNRLEDTIVKTNTDAIKEIVRQIRLRDLGGIIVVDFIDMDERKNRQKVMQALEETMRTDRAPYKILQFNDFGLVAITRKRVKQSLERTLCTPCPYCEGAGYVKSPQTVVGEILQEAHKLAKAVEGKDVFLRVAPEVAKLLKSNQNTYLQELEEILGRTVIVKNDPLLHQEKFDMA